MSFDSTASGLSLLEPELEASAIDTDVEQIQQHGEGFHRQAIRETDWSETAVLRIIERTPKMIPPVDPDDLSTFRLPEPQLEAKRFEQRAPPVSAHADSTHRCHIETITKPLLDRLNEEHPDIFAFIDEVDG